LVFNRYKQYKCKLITMTCESGDLPNPVPSSLGLEIFE
jgi:hypothetical protein